jgi:hypothetical protein
MQAVGSAGLGGRSSVANFAASQNLARDRGRAQVGAAPALDKPRAQARPVLAAARPGEATASYNDDALRACSASRYCGMTTTTTPPCLLSQNPSAAADPQAV